MSKGEKSLAGMQTKGYNPTFSFCSTG
ncbi:MAG: hypothetical protein EVA59_02880 [Limnobacter sp.]|nr:MAG: hypothetical protein DCE87_05390 [Betaproteobacteria bacterium]PZO21282.1 MAG: hypothetical protein DCE89_14290 [Betaproteobacteria bacterium]PZO26537.1 MAG: hypothetical protein DCE88_12125 [Betaproteobacteria bacterium]RZO94804.1 MAG: hypothetical protein EVA59_02880 [Limnobacter sp.]HAV73801.1 hypothetical protein [Limnobacter sp.]